MGRGRPSGHVAVWFPATRNRFLYEKRNKVMELRVLVVSMDRLSRAGLAAVLD